MKGLGIAALRGFGVLDALRAGVEDKSNADAREGALFAFEALVEKLGRMFEPYVVQVAALPAQWCLAPSSNPTSNGMCMPAQTHRSFTSSSQESSVSLTLKLCHGAL